MATPSEELIAAVNEDDAARVAELLAEDPFLASSRDLGGVSAIMLRAIDLTVRRPMRC